MVCAEGHTSLQLPSRGGEFFLTEPKTDTVGFVCGAAAKTQQVFEGNKDGIVAPRGMGASVCFPSGPAGVSVAPQKSPSKGGRKVSSSSTTGVQ